MNPEKLFDYLEGSLPEQEQAELERKLATDPQLQRELAIAREMHRRSRGSREVLGESEDIDIPAAPSGKLGRRLIAAFALLVLVNVLVGIAFIIGRKKPENPADLRARELAIRQQLTASLQKTAETALPAPTLATEEIHLFAAGQRTRNPRQQRRDARDSMRGIRGQGSARRYGHHSPGRHSREPGGRIPAGSRSRWLQTDFSSPTPRAEKPVARERVNIYVRITQARRPPRIRESTAVR